MHTMKDVPFYGNSLAFSLFRKETNLKGVTGSIVVYFVQPDTYFALSKEHANCLAETCIEINGQDYANQKGGLRDTDYKLNWLEKFIPFRFFWRMETILRRNLKEQEDQLINLVNSIPDKSKITTEQGKQITDLCALLEATMRYLDSYIQNRK